MNRASRIVILLCLWLVPASWAQLENSIPAPTRTVSGTRIGHYKDGPVPLDLSTLTIAAFVPNGAGGYNVLSGTGTVNGTFTIPNVPFGFYLLQFGSRYLWTNNTVVNGDFIQDYRSSIVAADDSTTLTFDLANLNPWQSNDVFEVVCPNNLTYGTYSGTVGDTAFTGTFNYDVIPGNANLSDATLGDRYFIAQLVTQNLGDYPFTALARFLAPPKFTQEQSSDTPVTGALKTVAQTNQFEANVNGADLLAQALAANPGATLNSSVVALSVYPGRFAHGPNTDTSDLVLYNGVPTIETNGDLGPVFYGNPYPPSKFPVYVSYSYTAQTSYLVPGATNPTSINTTVYTNTINLPTTTRPMKPLVTVVNNPSVGGLNFFGNHTRVGLTPLLKWSPPSVGRATYYLVSVYQLSNNEGSTVATRIARLNTQATALLVPPGLVSTGQVYVFVISAYYIPGLNFAKTPFFLGSTTAFAQAISGMMRP